MPGFIKKVIGAVLPIAGTVIGTAFGGPIGGKIGGALGGAVGGAISGGGGQATGAGGGTVSAGGGFDPRISTVSGGATPSSAGTPQAIQAAKTADIDEDENEAVTLAKQWANRLQVGQ